MCAMRILLCLALMATCAAATGKFSTCCTRTSSGKPRPGTVIESFIIQKEDLPCVHAVMFITNKGKIICSTPSAHWVKAKIEEITEKNKQEAKELTANKD